MKNCFAKNLGFNLALWVMLALPAIANTQYFTDTSLGDVNAGFRKTGTYEEKYEMVNYLGNFTNFLAMPAGTTINITNYNNQQLTNMCPDNLANLQWSVFSAFFTSAGSLTNSSGVFPADSMFYTVPRANPSVQTTPVSRFPIGTAPDAKQNMLSISSGANTISSSASYYTSTNVYNNTLVVLEPVITPINDQNDLDLMTLQIGDPGNSGQYTLAWGDMGGLTFTFTIENTTPSPFSAATVSDFYLNVPVGAATGNRAITDPLTGQTTGNADYIGYFTFYPSGTLTFTRASAVTVPAITAAGASTATNGFSPLSVVFTNSAAGTITNYVWNFGDGILITNTTGASVTNTYTTGGDYTITLTVYGPGGSSTEVLANYIVTSPTPRLSSVFQSGDKLVFSGTNAPAGVQYRILMATNLTTALASWTPVLTNTVSALGGFSYTNSTPTNQAAFFRLVSP
jgi:PKD repeat protein